MDGDDIGYHIGGFNKSGCPGEGIGVMDVNDVWFEIFNYFCCGIKVCFVYSQEFLVGDFTEKFTGFPFRMASEGNFKRKGKGIDLDIVDLTGVWA